MSAEVAIPDELASELMRSALARREPPKMDAAAWEAVARWAGASWVSGFLHSAFSDVAGPHSVPARILERGRKIETAAFLLRSQWIPDLLKALRDSGVIPVAFKGLGVAFRYYPAPELRPLGDVDLLFRPECRERVARAAETLGFARCSSDPAVLEFEDEESHHRIFVHARYGSFEAHHGLPRDFPEAAAREILDSTSPGEIFGLPVGFCQPHFLWAVLAVHMTASMPCNPWRWMLDLALIARHRTFNPDWSETAAFCMRHGLQVFACAASAMLRIHLASGPPPDFEEAMRAALSRRELISAAPVFEVGMRGCNGDRLMAARRFSGRYARGGGPAAYLWPHPGAVCMELGVRSDSPFFAVHRARLLVKRLGRGLRAVL
jgi:hypothetical protein